MISSQKENLDFFSLRNDLKDSVKHNYIDASVLSPLQKILLTTDGTVTDILEAYLSEQIRIIKLSEQLVSLTNDIPLMDLKEKTEVIVRKVLLQGRISKRNFIYAESIIVPERLEEKFRNALLKTEIPIGKVWFEYRIETFKQILTSSKESANSLANYFNIQPSDNMLSRTYVVVTSRKSSMMITEKFPENYFLKSF